MSKALRHEEARLLVNGTSISDIRYADDTVRNWRPTKNNTWKKDVSRDTHGMKVSFHQTTCINTKVFSFMKKANILYVVINN